LNAGSGSDPYSFLNAGPGSIKNKYGIENLLENYLNLQQITDNRITRTWISVSTILSQFRIFEHHRVNKQVQKLSNREDLIIFPTRTGTVQRWEDAQCPI